MPRFLWSVLTLAVCIPAAACAHDYDDLVLVEPTFDLNDLGYCYEPYEPPDFSIVDLESTPELVLDEDLGDVLEPLEPEEIVRPVEVPWYLATRETQRNS
jgi:hypothetical protein